MEKGVEEEGVEGVEGWDMEMLIHKQLVPMVSKDDTIYPLTTHHTLIM